MADIDADSDRITIKGEEANIGDIVEAWNAGKPLEVHPAAECFPMLEGKELQELAEDIKARGLQMPIAFLRGKLLDGRCRFAAMGADRPKVDVNNIGKFIEWLPDNTDPIPYVVSANSHRRHLIKKILADQIVERLKKLGHAEPVYKGGRGIKNPLRQKAVEEGQKYGIGESTIKRALAKVEGKKPVKRQARGDELEKPAAAHQVLDPVTKPDIVEQALALVKKMTKSERERFYGLLRKRYALSRCEPRLG